MTLDPTQNLTFVTVSGAYSDTDTSITLQSGQGSTLPDPSTEGEFNLVWWDSGNYSSALQDPNAEIIRVTAISTDTLTVTRAQENTGATTKNTGDGTYIMSMSLTAKMIQDIDTQLSGATNLFMAYDAAGGIDISSGSTITWDTEVRKDSPYTHSADADSITIGGAGDYKIEVDISSYITSGTNRSTSKAYLEKDTGSGFSEITGTEGLMYNRNATSGHSTTPITWIETFAAGDAIRVYATRINGSDTVKTWANGCRIFIKQL